MPFLFRGEHKSHSTPPNNAQGQVDLSEDAGPH